MHICFVEDVSNFLCIMEMSDQTSTLTELDYFYGCFRLQEKHNREKLRDHLKSMVTIQAELKEVQKRIQEMQGKIKDAHLRQERLLGSSSRYVSTNSLSS